MRKIPFLTLLRGVLPLLCLLWSGSATAQGYLRAEGTRIVDGQGRTVLLRGMGLGGWMLQEPYMLGLSGTAANQSDIRKKISAVIGPERTATFYKAWLQNFTRKADIDSMAAWGFNSVRLPMHYDLYTLPVDQEPAPGKQTWLPGGFALTDSLLRWCAANKMYLILDLHAAPGGQGADFAISDRDTTKASLWQSAEAQAKTVALWRKLAERYRNEPWIGAYDLINEPNWGFSDPKDKNGCAEANNGPIRDLLVRITDTIRAVDKKHLIIIEGNCWGNNYRGMLPPWDKNTVLSFHKYWNDNTDGALRSIVELRDQHNVPVWMGESGENSNAWFRDAIALLERHGIGWAWWPLKKIGINNPLEIRSNPDYKQLVAWWKGAGPKPDSDAAFRGLMQLADDSRSDRNTAHPDVVDAMFRQPRDNRTFPFAVHDLAQSPTVYAVDFDMGPNGSAYFSRDSGNYWVSSGKRTEWNRGWTYRNDAIDITPCTDSSGNGFQVDGLGPGEWLQWSVVAPTAGTYEVRLRLSGTEPLKMELFANGLSSVRETNGSSGWGEVRFPRIYLKKGINQIRLRSQQGLVNLNYLRFLPATAAGGF
ncbi:cellulase family glycosylhydrolase [Flaviaesturariibacter amylovorans]|uniref:CBM6 domain-containing protein n=1 Tax=Flaviaesturariibacter amylovorans TaxID=1084520 RepID=A0ABP8GJT8_9BACT